MGGAEGSGGGKMETTVLEEQFKKYKENVPFDTGCFLGHFMGSKLLNPRRQGQGYLSFTFELGIHNAVWYSSAGHNKCLCENDEAPGSELVRTRVLCG